MDAAHHKPPMTDRPDIAPSNVPGFLWRLGATLVLLYGFYLCMKLFLLSGILGFGYRGYQRSDSPAFRPHVTQAPPPAQTAALPVPLYPGARNTQQAHMLINDRNFFRCDYDVHASPETVLNYYRRWFHGQGWKDMTQEMISPDAAILGQVADIPFNPQNEEYLRFYDRLMRTQASFLKGKRHVMISTQPQRRTRTTRIGLQYSEHGTPEEFAAMMNRSLGLQKGSQADPGGLRFSQMSESTRARTAIHHSQKAPERFYAELLSHYQREGWSSFDAPMEVAPGLHTVLTRGRETGFLFVSAKDKGNGSTAMFTVSSL